MNDHTPDPVDEDAAPIAEPLEGDEIDVEESGPSGGAMALLAIALLMLAGGGVYLIGSIMSADSETADAQAAAEEEIAQFDPNEFESNFTEEDLDPDASPESIPMADDDSASTTPATPTTTEAPFVGVNPDDVALVFVNRVPGDDYGKVGYIDRNAERHIVDLPCVRIDWNVNGGLCLDEGSTIAPARGFLLNETLEPQMRFDLSRPSRAAVSPDGSVMAWTGFTLGHSYLQPGEFATITQLISVERQVGANLETIWTTFDIDGNIVSDSDRNYWGVTFVDSDRFYATIGYGGSTSIIEGSVQSRRLDVRFEDASCPEISPDGSTIVAKEMRGDTFQLVAIDVATGARRDLGETRSVDDQVEWIDDGRIAYGMPSDGGTEGQPAFDVWVLDVASGSQPQLLVPFADSPAAP